MFETEKDRIPEAIEYDRDAFRAELARVAAGIDDEIQNLEDGTAVTQEVLALEFTF